ncbi:unnamed protein product [Phytophthora lilii]|uniref:Unnamed protein product n=1 Tax=Phytophthora lilii TaxID=2077276 RepID=A0A9W6TGD7_9STRA|nr:unnamed protein product [Phytophthora lilii]
MLKTLKFVIALTIAPLVHGELEDVQSFAVPSFDYESLHDDGAPGRMLQALERGGIIALKNIPNYANTRERFLDSAVQCAVASEGDDEGKRYLSTKQFHDGTRRLTLRAAAGHELMDTDSESLKAMEANCPGHRALYEEFSSTLERAVDSFASALDQTEFTMGDGERHISARKLIGDAKRLDHFHAYEAASTPRSPDRRSLSADEIERDLSLAMHEDHGLFIAMAAPKFFSINAADGAIHERRLKSDASGLVIGSTELDEIVRPELKSDELVIMMGTGASRWLETSHHLPAVMHGMRMPEEIVWDNKATPGQRNLRAWFGKMTLLPAYQRLLESKMYFDEFTNRTTRHLLANGNSNDDIAAIGCASGRHLVESEGSCTYSICTLKPGVERPPTVGCNHACNYHTEFFDAKCEKKCDCTGTTTEADVCWMLCVARLPVSECALEDQECSGLKMICTANTTNVNSTTAPTATPEPSISTQTPLPTTMVPEPTLPVTEAPTESPVPTSITEIPVSTETPRSISTESPIATEAPSKSTEIPVPTEAPPSTSTESPASTEAPPSLSTEAPQPGTTAPADVPATMMPVTAAPIATQETPTTPSPSPAVTPTPTISDTNVPVAEIPSPAVTESPLPATTVPPSVPETTEPSTTEPAVPGGHC